MVVAVLPPPSAYKQHLLSQPSGREDIRIVCGRKLNHTTSYHMKMVDPDHTEVLSSASTCTLAEGEEATLGLTNKRRSAQLVLLDERQNICSRNASLASTSSGRKEDYTRRQPIPGKLQNLHHKRQPQVRVHLPKQERSWSFTADMNIGPKEPESSHAVQRRSVSALPALDIGPRGRHVARPCTPDPIRSVSSMSAIGKSPNTRPISYIDLLSVPYPQTAPPPLSFDNGRLKNSVGRNAALLTRQKTLEMYRANVKKTTETEVQYSFAILLIDTAQELARTAEYDAGSSPTDLLLEARQILQRLADKGYPFAQYYLADGYSSGFLNTKGGPDDDKALPLFVAASKHGHAEAGYRAGLCFEFGWGTRRDPAKAIQFYRYSASKNHPGAMTRLSRACLFGDLGIGLQYREGVKWLKRATESADKQYNTAPYDLGCLHETGYGNDIFKDEHYAAQLFTQAAHLDHVDAAFKLGQIYESGRLSCPRDPALSIHFYTIAASHGHAQAMFALCAWYMVGADPILQKDEGEAYEWAKKAAQLGLDKAQYALAYFAEAGIGGRRDPVEASTWYIKAAEQGEVKAIKRIRAIRNVSTDGRQVRSTYISNSSLKLHDEGFWGR